IVNLGSVDSFFSLKGVNLKFCSTLSHEVLAMFVTFVGLLFSAWLIMLPGMCILRTGCVCYRWEFGKGDIETGHRISLSKKRRLVAELEAAGEVEGAVKFLEHMKVIVARDAVTLGELETLLARAQVGVSLKASFMADMEVKD
ncbi:hypothetical protein Tco_0847893, partial [Tanacetum coccineum]